jgi:hypothetical protein
MNKNKMEKKQKMKKQQKMENNKKTIEGEIIEI